MKVHRIITTIEVENDNSITSVELIRLNTANIVIPLSITNITTNGSADDIEQVYNAIDGCRLFINDELKSIAYIINNCFDNHKCNIITDVNTITEINDDLLL